MKVVRHSLVLSVCSSVREGKLGHIIVECMLNLELLTLLSSGPLYWMNFRVTSHVVNMSAALPEARVFKLQRDLFHFG